MKLQKSLAILLILLSGQTVFSADKAVETKATINGNITTIWGSDIDNESTGFSESIDINFNWDVGGWGDYSSEVSGVNFNKAYGMAFVSGGLIRFKLEDDLVIDNNSGTDLLNIQILFENAWAKIVKDNFYIQLAADGTFYNREAGYNLDYSKDMVRANWAHIGSRIQKSYILDSDDWNTNGDMDAVKNEGSTAGLTLGADFEGYKTYLFVGSPDDMYDNTDNVYDFAWGNEFKPMDKMVISASVYTAINDPQFNPLGFGTAISHSVNLTGKLALEPYLAFDGQFQDDGIDPWATLDSEFAYGLTLKWPGPNGWGYEWLFDGERGTNYGFEANYSKRYSGFTLSGNMVTIDDVVSHNLQASLYEDTTGGLIPDFGGSMLFEVKDLTSDDMIYAYGAHIEYNYFNIVEAFARVENKNASLDEPEIYFGAGFSWLGLPNTTMTLRYDNEKINNTDESKGIVQVICNLDI